MTGPGPARPGSRLIPLATRFAPSWRRDDCRHEWEAEIAWRIERLERRGRRTRWTDLALSVRCLGTIPHLVWMWSHDWRVDMLGQDVRYALRTLAARPAFALTTIATLGLAIGANTAIFTVVDRLLWRRLAMEQDDRLVAIWPQKTISKRVFAEAAERTGPAVRLAAYSNWTFTLTGLGEAERLEGCGSSADLFDLLGARAAIGRTFAAGEDRPGRDRVAVISDRLWRRKFASDAAIAGRTVVLDGESVTILGVMPAAFEFPQSGTDVWRPLPFDAANARDYGANYLSLVGRLSPGTSVEQARDLIQRFAADFAARDAKFPKAYAGQVGIVPLRASLLGTTATTLVILFAAVGCILLVACANIAGLLLARAASRRREIAVRSALGASRLQLVRQLLVESLVLALAGCALGLVVARSAIGAIAAGLPASLPGLAAADVDGRVLLFSLAISCLTALAFGLAPALDLSHTSPGQALESGARSSGSRRSRRVRRLLVVGEIAVAVILVTAAGLLVRSLWRMTHVDSGFVPDRVLTFRVSTDGDAAAIRGFHTRLFERLLALPGVAHAGAIQLLPMTPGNWDPDVSVEGRPVEPNRRPVINWRATTADYFRAMQIPLIRGRLFTDADAGGEPVALVNQTMADRIFPGEDPIGRRVATFFEGDHSWARVVGIVGDVRQHGPAARPRPEMYRPLSQCPLGGVSVVVETAAPPERLAPLVRRVVSEVDPDAPVWSVMPMRDVMGLPIAQDRFLALLLAGFASIALALGGIGVFGVMSYDVAQRAPEIGLRLALGADPGRVLRGVIADGLRITAAGLAIGLAAAVAAGRLATGFLFGISPTDPATLAAVPAILAAVSLLAVYLPARRAAAIDPLATIRR